MAFSLERKVMTLAVSQILKQTKFLSPQEQLELVNELLGQTRQNAEPVSLLRNGVEKDEAEEMIDVSALKHVPPKASYEIKVKFVDGGRGEPRRYDFGDLFDDEKEVDSED